MSLNYELGSQLYHARISHGYTQAQVSEAVGISTRWYLKLEKGLKFPSGITFLRLKLFLDLDLEALREYAGLLEPINASRGAYV